MDKKLSELIGWYGVGAILIAYLLNSLAIITAAHPLYSVLNFTGAISIVIDSWKQKNYQPVVLNIIWALVAAFALIQLF